MLKTGTLGIAVITLMLSAGAHAQQDDKDIVETAMAAGSFTTLTKALKAADLVDTLKGQGPFTVFAPTDEAFAKLPAGTLNDLLKPENKQKLQRILTYHVVPGRVSSTDVVTNLARIRISASPSTRLSASAFVQYNDLADEVITSIRGRFIHAPLSDLYLVVEERRSTRDAFDPVQSLAVKITRQLAF